MAMVSVVNIVVLDNPCAFDDPFKFEITFECYENLPLDLEWKLTYVGSADSSDNDQVLDTVLVGPVPEGRHKFVFQTDAPDPSKLPSSEIVGVTVVLLECAYNDQPFIRIGYYLANNYHEQELLDAPPEKPILEKLRRYLVSDQPRITRYQIRWRDTDPDPLAQPPDVAQVGAVLEEDDEEAATETAEVDALKVGVAVAATETAEVDALKPIDSNKPQQEEQQSVDAEREAESSAKTGAETAASGDEKIQKPQPLEAAASSDVEMTPNGRCGSETPTSIESQ